MIRFSKFWNALCGSATLSIFVVVSGCGSPSGEVIATFALGEGDGELGLTPGGFETPAICPGPISIGGGVLYVLDRVNQRVLAFDQVGRGVARSISIDEALRPRAIAADDGGAFLWSIDQEAAPVIARIDRDAAEAGAGFGAAGPSAAIMSAFDEAGLSLDDEQGAGAGFGAPTAPFATEWTRTALVGTKERDFRVTRSADLKDISISAEDGESWRYASSRRILDVSILAAKPDARFAAILLTHDDGAMLTALFRDGQEKPELFPVPSLPSVCAPAGLVTLAGDGQPLFLSVGERSAFLVRLPKKGPIAIPQLNRRRAPAPEVAPGYDDLITAQQLEDDGVASAGFGGSRTREQMLETAYAYLDYRLTISPENYQPTIKDICYRFKSGVCNSQCNAWTRPPYLTTAKRLAPAESTSFEVPATPYAWGGFDSLDQLASKIQMGRPAGDVCAERKKFPSIILDGDLAPNPTYVAGVDCSGFVSRVWGIRRQTTQGLAAPEVSVAIDWADFKPGDIALKAGSHVRLFESWSGEARDTARFIEAAISDCGGSVCRNSYKISALAASGYKPYRAIGLTGD